MKVSVIITCYNYGHYVCKAVESILAQDYEGVIECIVVDDGSTDDSEERLKPYLDRITYLYQENAGQCAAYNAGFGASTGEILCQLDADDTFKTNCLSTLAAIFEANPEVGMIHFGSEHIDGEGNWVDHGGRDTESPHSFSKVPWHADGDVAERLLKEDLPWVFGPGQAYRRSVCERIFPLPSGVITHGADGFVALAAALISQVAFCNESLGFTLIHSKNFHNSYADETEHSKEMVVRYRELSKFLARVMQLEGMEDSLHILGSWRYLRLLSVANRVMPLKFLASTLAALWKRRYLGIFERARLTYKITMRALDRSLRRRYTANFDV